ncbi:MAG: hypothetical protein UU81_C0030G0004 [Microgenomates group bacterium GW2011_GWC1_41_8]|uniref:DUF458 domain-containing protein n=2 Tax=Candidatus Roizmaniibacteriota TaxID=1752723 RepID=A0A0G0T624_9BACT|nr:MAG: hypothetical protein UT85_C0019G0005 [Candidatus Levybacteria bacterium GW2011_GWA2_40_16]KKR72459.1 MAG: hypothetical protein UU14_C0005G0027 [Candidatus Roizmanbacteria bacterium GW2011_GWB1_40_7]KKR94795.1 MAG: hypothetical protein UU41_C0003G0014 [Candidatus Roizmanbacteria bacterium GW2011_GWA1_41_13]KKS23398.1 MAG: hypothetical protein UU81_C0030G0004 [Microgenomates group bacterium GW2011_GWC1_41_8]OGK47692.1 MAG: hypothetical protein A3A55_01585 [Candidatus Roizmanbacteria bacte
MIQYKSITYGLLTLSEVRARISDYMKDRESQRYQVVIGTDSQRKNGSQTDFVTAIIVHRVGSGGIYFWNRTIDNKQRVLKQRMFEEATRSLETAQKLLETFKENGISDLDFAIHVDIGKRGPTREILSEVVSMIRGSGFIVKTKPDSYGASKVADRHT